LHDSRCRAARVCHEGGAGLSPCARNTIREAISRDTSSSQHAGHAVRRNRTRSAAGTFSDHRQRSRSEDLPPEPPEVWLVADSLSLSLRRPAAPLRCAIARAPRRKNSCNHGSRPRRGSRGRHRSFVAAYPLYYLPLRTPFTLSKRQAQALARINPLSALTSDARIVRRRPRLDRTHSHLTPLLRRVAVEMPSTINNKRQREDSRVTASARGATVQRDPKEIRNSIKSLHEKPHLSDITVSVQLSNEHEAQDFRCISALLASASRVLEAMLFGPMADASLLDQPRHLRILRLRGTEPWCFEQMLSFIHGQHICEPQPADPAL
jgi:hypothetical protein